VATEPSLGGLPPPRRVAIVGVGLIGGSLGLRWRQSRAVGHVVGYGRTPANLERAVQLGAIDEAAPDLSTALAGAEVIVLAAPIGACLAMAEEVARLAEPGALITDVGSTKAAIEQAMAEALAPRAAEPHPPAFIGGHPMAGAERGGVEAADPYLFENAVWVLCPGRCAPPEAVGRLRPLVEATGAHVVLLDPVQHDRRVAAISHLPQLVAVALAEVAGEGEAADPGLLALAGGGFRDTTRIAQSPAEMWLDVLATNRGPVLENLDRMQARLAALRAAVAAGDAAALRRHFAQAAAVRQRVPTRQKGLLPAYHDLVLFVPDRPGVLGRLCTALGDRGINVQDIEILRLREGEGGTLRLGFRTAEEAGQALEVLAGLGYAVQRR
jgi:prephenate dehydrogenase